MSRASLPYLKGWAGGDDEKLLAELAAIDRIARELLALIGGCAFYTPNRHTSTHPDPEAEAEEVRQRRQPDALLPSLEEPPREPDRVDDRRRHPPAGQPFDLAVEEPHVEAGVVGDEHGVAGELEEAADGELDGRRTRNSPGSIPVSAAIGAGSGRRGLTSVSKRSSSSSPRTRTAPISQIADDPGDRPVVSRSKTTYVAASSASSAPGGVREPDARAAPGEACVAIDDVGEQRACEPGGDVPQRIQRLRGLLGRHRPVPGLDELHEPVGRVERELHARSLGEHMFVCNGKEKAATPARPSRPRKRTRR